MQTLNDSYHDVLGASFALSVKASKDAAISLNCY
jgi:hypothetical protein